MNKSTISTSEIFAMFPDEATAREYLERRRWPDGPRCPVCGLGEKITKRKDGYYRCNQCREDFTVRTGTVFERSHVPLLKWLATFLLVRQNPEIPSEKLARELGVTQKTGWLILRRLREAMNAKAPKELDAIADKVLAYRPAPKSEPAKRRRNKAAKIKRRNQP